MHPIILLEAEGTDYWAPILDFVRKVQLEKGLISSSDLSLFKHTTDIGEACDHITHFYSCYHSQRYASGNLVLRLRKAPGDDLLKRLNEEFGDIVVEGQIERAEPTAAEVDDNDALDYDRISFLFDRRQFGRLRQLIDRLNDEAGLPDTTQIPHPMTEEQAERPW